MENAETNEGDRAKVDPEWKLPVEEIPSTEQQAAGVAPRGPEGREATKANKFGYQSVEPSEHGNARYSNLGQREERSYKEVSRN